MTDRPQLKLNDIWSRDEKSLPSRLGSVAMHAAALGVLCLPLWRPVLQLPQPLAAVPAWLPAPLPALPAPVVAARRMASGAAWSEPAPAHVTSQAIQPLAAPAQIVALRLAESAPWGMAAGPAAAGPFNGGADRGAGGEPGGTCVGANCIAGAAAVTQPPVAIYQPDPEYSDAARKVKLQGTVELDVVIGADGRVSHAAVVSPLGMGLDEKAVEAVMQWRFQPARANGRPVAVNARIDVNFRLY